MARPLLITCQDLPCQHITTFINLGISGSPSTAKYTQKVYMVVCSMHFLSRKDQKKFGVRTFKVLRAFQESVND